MKPSIISRGTDALCAKPLFAVRYLAATSSGSSVGRAVDS
ncbi:hypothetical protein SEA_TOMSAWYER_171 [Streptomyces phage TomSawyer]|nr:hypothetical protein SEA_TOMSAWYER_171 [Streptomyces phage TomSawyer]